MDKKTEKKEVSIKVVFLGYTKGGKSNIISQYVHKRFIEQFNSTIGANYENKTIETQSGIVRFDIWDTAGQDKFKTLVRFFFKDGKIGVFVYDPYDRESFEKTQWYISEMKKELGKKALYILCENKNDITDKKNKFLSKKLLLLLERKRWICFLFQQRQEMELKICLRYVENMRWEQKKKRNQLKLLS